MGAVFDLTSNKLRPIARTSADAAGLSIYAGLIKYEETVVKKAINHAIRVTFGTTQVGYDPMAGATHQATDNTDSSLPWMGMRLRLLPGFDCSNGGTIQNGTVAFVVCAAMKKYGLIVADNGSPWYIGGQATCQWGWQDDSIGIHAQVQQIKDYKINVADWEVLAVQRYPADLLDGPAADNYCRCSDFDWCPTPRSPRGLAGWVPATTPSASAPTASAAPAARAAGAARRSKPARRRRAAAATPATRPRARRATTRPPAFSRTARSAPTTPRSPASAPARRLPAAEAWRPPPGPPPRRPRRGQPGPMLCAALRPAGLACCVASCVRGCLADAATAPSPAVQFWFGPAPLRIPCASQQLQYARLCRAPLHSGPRLFSCKAPPA